jgi:hypothetical protein
MANGSPTFAEVGTFDKNLPAENNSPEDYNSYPTKVDELHDMLLEKARANRSADPEEYVFTIASDILVNAPEAPPALRSALFEVLSMVPGTKLDPDATDPEGRSGASVWIVLDEDEYRHQRYEVFFEPDTAQVHGFRNTFFNEGEPTSGKGTIYAYAVLLETGVVDSVDERS